MANENAKLKTKNAKVEAKTQDLSKEKVVKAKAEKKVTVAATAAKSESKAPVAKQSATSLTVDVYGIDGKKAGTVSLPAELFGDTVNKILLAQAVRVYLANQRQGNASTKTRGEVDGSTRKIYRQKGTGRARHGSLRAPIFVKGGIVFGPKPRDFSLSLPTKMKRKALSSALSAKLSAEAVTVVSGFETLEAKTKIFVEALTKLGKYSKKHESVLLVTAGKSEAVRKSSRNVPGVTFMSANRLNAYEVLKTKHLIVMKEAIAQMQETFLK